MALVKCKGCGQMISDKASKCPKCGYVNEVKDLQSDIRKHDSAKVDSQPINPERKSSSQKWLIGIIVLLALAIMGLVCWHFSQNATDKANDISTQQEKNDVAVVVNEHKVEPNSSLQKENIEIEQKEETQIVEVESPGIKMSLWGEIGDSDDVDFELEGNTGYYTYTRNGTKSSKRTLAIDSYDKETGRCILNAYLDDKNIGKFDGVYKEEEVDMGDGEFKTVQSYQGIFTSVNGVKLDFSLYND